MKRLEMISPLDGRYNKYTEILKDYFSEYAYLKYRFNIEIDWLDCLMRIKTISNSLNVEEQLKAIKNSFSLTSAKKIKEIENKTNHDVKAIEYHIRKCFDQKRYR